MIEFLIFFIGLTVFSLLSLWCQKKVKIGPWQE